MFYKNTFKFFQLTKNMTYKIVSYNLKKISFSHHLLLLSQNTPGRLETGMLKTILFLKVVTQPLCLASGNIIAQRPPDGVWLELSFKRRLSRELPVTRGGVEMTLVISGHCEILSPCMCGMNS